MRIVYMLTSLGMGGAERQALALAGRMAGRGHTVALLALKPRLSEEWPTTLEIIHLDMKKSPVSLLAGMVKGRWFLREFHPDLIHSHGFHANMVARLLKIFVQATTVLSTVHNIYEGGRLRMLAYRLTDGLSRRTIMVSEAAARRYLRLKAVPQQKCLVLTNGIDAAEFAPDPQHRARIRAEMSANGEFIWLAAGRIVAAKDYPNLLRAFTQVRAACPEAQLWIAGAQADAKLKRTQDGLSYFVSGFAVERGSMEQVRLLGLRRDMPSLLDAADGFVSSSAWEGMPLALGEAMAMEKPVVATDVGGVRELVGDAGFIVPARSPEGLAEAMIELMRRMPEARHSLGRRARERIVSNFSMDARADEWEALYRRTGTCNG
jgi:glycosyltransferase involved in cell wall biosynthesis